MIRRLSLRALAVITAAPAAVIVPASAAFADSTPAPSLRFADERPDTPAPAEGAGAGLWASVSSDRATPSAAPAPERVVLDSRSPSVLPRGGVAAGDKPAPMDLRRAEVVKGGKVVVPERTVSLPRGGVAAGDKPAPAPALKVTPAGAGAGSVTVPRGGVAAGEQPATAGGATDSAVIGGTVAAFAVLAGTGGLLLRRRAAHQL